MDRKIIWILIIVVILGLAVLKKQATYDLEYIGKMGEDVAIFYDTSLFNYNGHLLSISWGRNLNLLDSSGQEVCYDWNSDIDSFEIGGILEQVGGQFINDKIYSLIHTSGQLKVLQCDNIVWNCDLDDYTTCSGGDCMDMSCSLLFTAIDDIWGLCSDGSYIYGTDWDNNQLIKYTMAGNKIGTIPLDYHPGGCEYQDGMFYIQDSDGHQIKAYDSSFTLQDVYSMNFYPGRDLAKIGNRFYSLIKETTTSYGGVFEIITPYTYTDFIADKDTYLSGGSFSAFITNANQWVM